MPIQTADKVYIHMPKTGGSWMSSYLKIEHGGRMVGSHGHIPARFLKPHEIEGKLLWGTIRDPWSWYLSWYAHGMATKHYQEHLAVYGNGNLEFKDVLMGALSRDKERCPENVGAIWSLPNEGQGRRDYLGGLGGLYTWAFFYIFGDQVKTLVDTAFMAEGVAELFGTPVDKKIYPPTNTRRTKIPKIPEEMFDDEMVDAVYDEDGFLISHLGYEGPFSCLPETVLRL